MNTPAVHTPTEIQNWQCAEEFEPGRYRPARCLGFELSLLHSQRWKIAWRVLVGRYDALDWNAVEPGTPTVKELERMVR